MKILKIDKRLKILTVEFRKEDIGLLMVMREDLEDLIKGCGEDVSRFSGDPERVRDCITNLQKYSEDCNYLTSACEILKKSE